MLGFSQNYVTPYALAMQATTTQIGLLSAIPNTFMILTQLISPTLAERVGSRKGVILPVVLLHVLAWLPILLLPYIFHSQQIWWLIAFATLCVTFDSMSNAPWNSMMADLVPEAVRGRYFSSRNRVSNFVIMVFSIVAGDILQVFIKNGFIGFTIIFAGALLSRLFSLYFLSQMFEPPAVIVKSKQPGIFKLSRELISSNTGRFILFNALMLFTTNIAGPFFSVYALRELKFSYTTYVILNSVGTLSALLFMPYWGKRIDRAGIIKILKISSVIVPFAPLTWLVSTNAYYLCIIQVVSGLAWSGYNLASSIFLYEAAPQENRIRYIALNNALVYAGISLGALLGGAIAPIVPAILGNSLLTIFLISGLARVVVIFTMLPHIKEVRRVSEVSTKELLFGGIKPPDLTDLPRTTLQSIDKLWKRLQH